MARRPAPLSREEFAATCARLDAGSTDRADLKAATMHLIALLVEKAPGNSVEVRIPPHAAVQAPAVVEMDAETWIALGRGGLAWADATKRASGERSDLSELFPLDP